MSIVLENLTKHYGTQPVVDRVSLEIADGELFVLLGGSGSGKSTILRMIAGLTPCDSGRVLLHGRDVTHLTPQARGTGFVFQNYSIFRHMTLQENIEFGLEIRKVPKAERVRRGEELLDLVGLAGFGDRYAHEISGGQQQRVALARALAYEPTVLLLDEPLGALDVKIRVQLRRSLKEIQRRLSVTTILVTHDQEEAYELADRIGVLNHGVLLEVGPPEQLYAQPRKLFVASFLGGGTVIAGRIMNGQGQFGRLRLPVPPNLRQEERASVELLFRPEQVVLSEEEPRPGAALLGKGSVIEQVFSGPLRRLRLRLPRLPGTRQVAPQPSFGEEGLIVEAIAPANAVVSAGELWVSLRGWTILEPAPPRLLVLDTDAAPTQLLRLAGWLAAQMQAAVTLVACDKDRTEESLLRKTFAARAHAASLNGEDLQVIAGEVAEHLAGQCGATPVEMVIVPRNLGGDEEGLDDHIGELLERMDVPLLVGAGGIEVIRRILICTRTGEPGKNDVRFGGRLARYLGARVTLLHITRNTGAASPLAARHLRQASGALQALEVPCEVAIRPNPRPADAILEQAVDHDLIVIGGHNSKPGSVFKRHNVTMQVLQASRCPVLVIPPQRR